MRSRFLSDSGGFAFGDFTAWNVTVGIDVE